MAGFDRPGDPYFPNQGNNGWLEESEEEPEEEPEEDPEEESEGEPEAEAEGGPAEPMVDQEEEEAEAGLEEEPSEDEDGNVIAAKPETFDSAKRLVKKQYDHNHKKGEKPAETEDKKENDNKKGKNNKRKGRLGSESAKKQQTVTVNVASTQVPFTPHAPASAIPSTPSQY
ncbi:uncharacterized protein LOC122194852 [Lactuca sativa]|uniref:uncharacterized protein LOC122194852 n=1 Tax=Lactuca sativa TaxID=4236 RepID=UPI0022AF6809|nr:uncharacterized protein LOC122194852 [Lactuca sativa]